MTIIQNADQASLTLLGNLKSNLENLNRIFEQAIEVTRQQGYGIRRLLGKDSEADIRTKLVECKNVLVEQIRHYQRILNLDENILNALEKLPVNHYFASTTSSTNTHNEVEAFAKIDEIYAKKGEQATQDEKKLLAIYLSIQQQAEMLAKLLQNNTAKDKVAEDTAASLIQQVQKITANLNKVFELRLNMPLANLLTKPEKVDLEEFNAAPNPAFYAKNYTPYNAYLMGQSFLATKIENGTAVLRGEVAVGNLGLKDELQARATKNLTNELAKIAKIAPQHKNASLWLPVAFNNPAQVVLLEIKVDGQGSIEKINYRDPAGQPLPATDDPRVMRFATIKQALAADLQNKLSNESITLMLTEKNPEEAKAGLSRAWVVEMLRRVGAGDEELAELKNVTGGDIAVSQGRLDENLHDHGCALNHMLTDDLDSLGSAVKIAEQLTIAARFSPPSKKLVQALLQSPAPALQPQSATPVRQLHLMSTSTQQEVPVQTPTENLPGIATRASTPNKPNTIIGFTNPPFDLQPEEEKLESSLNFSVISKGKHPDSNLKIDAGSTPANPATTTELGYVEEDVPQDIKLNAHLFPGLGLQLNDSLEETQEKGIDPVAETAPITHLLMQEKEWLEADIADKKAAIKNLENEKNALDDKKVQLLQEESDLLMKPKEQQNSTDVTNNKLQQAQLKKRTIELELQAIALKKQIATLQEQAKLQKGQLRQIENQIAEKAQREFAQRQQALEQELAKRERALEQKLAEQQQAFQKEMRKNTQDSRKNTQNSQLASFATNWINNKREQANLLNIRHREETTKKSNIWVKVLASIFIPFLIGAVCFFFLSPLIPATIFFGVLAAIVLHGMFIGTSIAIALPSFVALKNRFITLPNIEKRQLEENKNLEESWGKQLLQLAANKGQYKEDPATGEWIEVEREDYDSNYLKAEHIIDTLLGHPHYLGATGANEANPESEHVKQGMFALMHMWLGNKERYELKGLYDYETEKYFFQQLEELNKLPKTEANDKKRNELESKMGLLQEKIIIQKTDPNREFVIEALQRLISAPALNSLQKSKYFAWCLVELLQNTHNVALSKEETAALLHHMLRIAVEGKPYGVSWAMVAKEVQQDNPHVAAELIARLQSEPRQELQTERALQAAQALLAMLNVNPKLLASQQQTLLHLAKVISKEKTEPEALKKLFEKLFLAAYQAAPERPEARIAAARDLFSAMIRVLGTPNSDITDQQQLKNLSLTAIAAYDEALKNATGIYPYSTEILLEYNLTRQMQIGMNDAWQEAASNAPAQVDFEAMQQKSDVVFGSRNLTQIKDDQPQPSDSPREYYRKARDEAMAKLSAANIPAHLQNFQQLCENFQQLCENSPSALKSIAILSNPRNDLKTIADGLLELYKTNASGFVANITQYLRAVQRLAAEQVIKGREVPWSTVEEKIQQLLEKALSPIRLDENLQKDVNALLALDSIDTQGNNAIINKALEIITKLENTGDLNNEQKLAAQKIIYRYCLYKGIDSKAIINSDFRVIYKELIENIKNAVDIDNNPLKNELAALIAEDYVFQQKLRLESAAEQISLGSGIWGPNSQQIAAIKQGIEKAYKVFLPGVAAAPTAPTAPAATATATAQSASAPSTAPASAAKPAGNTAAAPSAPSLVRSKGHNSDNEQDIEDIEMDNLAGQGDHEEVPLLPKRKINSISDAPKTAHDLAAQLKQNVDKPEELKKLATPANIELLNGEDSSWLDGLVTKDNNNNPMIGILNGLLSTAATPATSKPANPSSSSSFSSNRNILFSRIRSVKPLDPAKQMAKTMLQQWIRANMDDNGKMTTVVTALTSLAPEVKELALKVADELRKTQEPDSLAWQNLAGFTANAQPSSPGSSLGGP